MKTISSHKHRDFPRDLIHRWMYGDSRRKDGDDLVQLVHFNNAYRKTENGAKHRL